MNYNKQNIRLLVLILPVIMQVASFAQGVIQVESGGRIVSEAGSYWVVDNGNITLTSLNAANPVTMGNLRIESDASLTVESLNYLTVAGTLTNASGNNGLVVKSGGSLITGSTGVSAMVERDIVANEWHFISAPVAGATANVFQGCYLQKHTESTNLFTDITSASEPLTPMVGFSVYGDAVLLPKATYTGTLNAGAQSFTTTYTGTGKGWNLVGNPYAASIDWMAATGWTKTNINDAMYVHVSSSTWASWVGGVGNNEGTQYIAPGQGFFVEATAAGTLGMTDAVCVHNPTAFFKNSEVVNNLIRLEVSGNNYKDEMVVRFLPESTPGFDGDYDAHKFFGDVAGAAQIYSLGNTSLAINTLPETSTVPVGIHSGANGNYTIKATEINDFSQVSLEDTRTGVFTNLLTDDYTFNFTTGENEQRFVLHFGPLSVKEQEKTVANIYSSRQTVYVDMIDQSRGEIFIYNVSGQLAATVSAISGINKIDLTITGFYIVRLVTDKAMVVEKVWIE